MTTQIHSTCSTMKRNTILSIGILISFFLPWINFTFFSLGGYEIPTSLDKLYNISMLFKNGEKPAIAKISYLLYLIPIASVFNIIKDISKQKTYIFFNEFVFGGIAVIAFFIKAHQINEDPTSVLSFGYYFTIIFSVLGILSYFSPSVYDVFGNNFLGNNPEHTDATNKSELLNQLSTLHSLQEKGALTDDIYEQERQVILSKLQNQESNQEIIQSEEIVSELENNEDYEYEEESWFLRRKIWLIIAIISSVIGGYFLYETSKTSEDKIVGLWELQFDKINYDELSEKSKSIFYPFIEDKSSIYANFSEDKSIYLDFWFKDKDKANAKVGGTYTLSPDGKILQLTYKDENLEFQIFQLENNTMILMAGELKLPFKKL